MKPSYVALGVSGILIGIFLFIILKNLYNNKQYDTQMYQTLMLILMSSIAVGVHGLGHAYAEVNYNFDPLNNNVWIY